MGTQCCAPEFDKYEIKVEPQLERANTQTRRGLPADSIAIPMSEIINRNPSPEKIKGLSNLIFKIAEHEKKFKTPFRINREPILQNRLNDPYYILALGVFYIGQWVYNEQLGQNVPGGIGRLYQQQTISEGCFKTIILDQSEMDYYYNWNDLKDDEIDEQQQMDYAGNLFKHVVKSFEDNSYQFGKPQRKDEDKIAKMLNVNRRKENLSNAFVVKLHGQGRICTQDPEAKEEIQMEGEFDEGILNDRGTLRIIQQGEETYLYVGSWRSGYKHGKGIEKTAKYKYEGTFVQNVKSGKGVQTFIGSARQQHELERGLQKMQQKLLSEGQGMRLEAMKKIRSRQYQQDVIQEKLQEMQLPVQNIKLVTEKCLILDLNFILDRLHRTIFTEQYVGDFVAGKMEGQGVYTWPNGKTYRGKWKEDRLNGKGEFYWPDGSYYQGEYLNDERHGQGIMIWSVSKRYRGNWAYGLRHGYGESIEINMEKQLMTIQGSVWNRDKVSKKLFIKESIPIPQIGSLQKVYQQVQQQMLGSNDRNEDRKAALNLGLELAHDTFQSIQQANVNSKRSQKN